RRWPMSMGIPRNRPELVRLLFIASLTCLPYSAARPQALTSDPAAAARAVGTAFLKAVQAADWKAAAGFLDLAAIDFLPRSQLLSDTVDGREVERSRCRLPIGGLDRLEK